MFRLQTLEIPCERTRMDACLSCRRAVQAEPSSVPLRLQHRRAQNASPTCRRGIQNLSCIVHSDAVLWRWRAARRRRRAARRRRRRRRRGSKTGQTSTATHRGRLGRVAIRTGSSAAREPSSQAPSAWTKALHTRGPLSVLQSKSDRFCHLVWTLRPGAAAQGTAKPWRGAHALA